MVFVVIIVIFCAKLFVNILEKEKIMDMGNNILDLFEIVWMHIEIHLMKQTKFKDIKILIHINKEYLANI